MTVPSLLVYPLMKASMEITLQTFFVVSKYANCIFEFNTESHVCSPNINVYFSK